VNKNEVQNSSSILDYADYVEMACEEESGTYRSYPSVRDVKVTRDLIRAGQLLKIEVLDHVIVGNPGQASLRELEYFQ